MLDNLRAVSIKLQWLKPISLSVMILSLVAVVYILLTQSNIAQDDFYLLPAIISSLWSFLLFWMLYTFVNVPDKPTKSLSFFKRIAVHLKRFGYYIVTLVSLLTTLTIVFFTARAVRVWLGDFS